MGGRIKLGFLCPIPPDRIGLINYIKRFQELSKSNLFDLYVLTNSRNFAPINNVRMINIKGDLIFPLRLMSSIIHEKLEILDIQYFYGLYGELGKGSMRYLFSALNMFLILLLSRIFNTSTVLTMHSVINDISKESIIDEIKSRNDLNFFLRLFNSMVGFFTDKVVVLSAFQFEEIRKYVNSSKIQMIPHGFDDKKPPEKKEHSGFTFLFFGLIRPNKGVLDLLISFDLLPKIMNKMDNSFLLIRIGDSHRIVNKFKNKNFLCIPKVNNNIYHLFFNAANVVLMTSFVEGFGIPVIQAINSKVPLLLTNIQIFKEIVGNYKYYLNPYDVDDWINKILEIREKSSDSLFSTQLYSNISDYYRRERAMGEYVKLYKQIGFI